MTKKFDIFQDNVGWIYFCFDGELYSASGFETDTIL